MGPKKRSGNKEGSRQGVGLSLFKDRNKSKKAERAGASWLHSSELDDGYDWGRLNLRSVTEESQLDEFLSIAQLAGTEFTAEKLNMKVVSGSTHYTGLPSEMEKKEARKAEEENRQYLSIPRRPSWDSSTTAEQLQLHEREAFLSWRRGLAHLQEDERLTLTPFERNLEFWRQLWRVLEKSDIVVQILDARSPLLFRCEDLEKYVCEIAPKKVNMLLLSKADLLSPIQRQAWLDHFSADNSVVVAFWSAKLETERLESMAHTAKEPDSSSIPDPGQDVERLSVGEHEASAGMVPDSTVVMGTMDTTPTLETVISDSECARNAGSTSSLDVKHIGEPPCTIEATPTTKCRVDLPVQATAVLSGDQLLDLLLHISPVAAGTLTTVGMVGYPNVGKSSTINALFQGKKVPVSATPGRTKHFQTLFLSEKVMVCDCPGLVFPSFVSSKAEMICSGILPIDQLHDHTPPISLVCQRIPRAVLKETYGIRIPCPKEGEDASRVPYSNELLAAYGSMRGFKTSHGQPDEARSSRYILKDYVTGKLLFCQPPPGIDEHAFNHQLSSTLPPTSFHQASPEETEGEEKRSEGMGEGERESLIGAPLQPYVGGVPSEFDDDYFAQGLVRAIIKGRSIGMPSLLATSVEAVVDTSAVSGVMVKSKPWKKHHNKHRKEKTRRTQMPCQ